MGDDVSREKPPAHPRIIFENGDVETLPTDTVASALLRSGLTTFSRGPKYHRPRGPFCLAGSCAQCHMRVDGEPNIPTCLTPVRDGMRVERQNVLGSGDTDLLRAVDFIYRAGIDHHHLMTKFKTLNAATQAIARRLSGVGEPPTRRLAPRAARNLVKPLVVIGAGPAGLAAALSAVRCGVAPLVLDGHEQVGGHVAEGLSSDPQLDTATMARIAAEIGKTGEIVTGARVIGLYAESGKRWVAARVDEELWLIETTIVILATGGLERPIPFESNDLPGVFGGRGLLGLARRHGVLAGESGVVIGSTPDALAVARGLTDQGMRIAAVLDPAGMLPASSDFQVLAGTSPVRALGGKRVEGLRVRDRAGNETRLACDVIAATPALQPAYELGAQVGARTEYRPEAGGFALVLDDFGCSSVDWVYGAGGVAGEPVGPIASGDLAGLAATCALVPEEWDLERALKRKVAERRAALNRDARR